MTMPISGVNRETIDKVWDRVGPMLEPNLSELDTIDNVKARLKEGTLQLVLHLDDETMVPLVACVTEILNTPKGKKVNICYCAGGFLDKWIDDLDKMEAWARNKGCVSVMISHAREGWKPVLAPKGYKVKAVILEKALTNGRHD